jgi:hypothetical protein
MYVLHSRQTDELELGGCSSEYKELAELLLAGHGCLQLADVADPSPYDGALAVITVKRREGQPATVNLSKELQTLEIVGDKASLALLAENLSDFGAQSRPGEHWHLEYFPDHFYLGATSQPLVATLTDPDSGMRSRTA